MLAAGSKDFDAVLDRCEAHFRIGSRKADKFTYLGLEVVNDASSGTITLSQSQYIASLCAVQVPLQDHRSGTVELPQKTLEALAHAVGEIMWVAASTRCDIAAEAGMLVAEMTSPSMSTVLRVNKLLRYLKFTKDQSITYSPQSSTSDRPLEFKLYVDAALQNAESGKSRGGHLLAIGPIDNRQTTACPLAVIGWRSALIQRVVTSSFSAELLNLCSAVDTAIWSRDLFAEMLGQPLPISVFTDCLSIVENSRSLRLQVTERRLTSYMWMLRDILERGDIKPLVHVSTRQQLADGLTKRSPMRRNLLRKALDGWGHDCSVE